MARLNGFTVVKRREDFHQDTTVVEHPPVRDIDEIARYDPERLELSSTAKGSLYAAVWVPRSRNLAYCVGHPTHFRYEDMSPWLPTDLDRFCKPGLFDSSDDDDDFDNEPCWPLPIWMSPTTTPSSDEAVDNRPEASPFFSTAVAEDKHSQQHV